MDPYLEHKQDDEDEENNKNLREGLNNNQNNNPGPTIQTSIENRDILAFTRMTPEEREAQLALPTTSCNICKLYRFNRGLQNGKRLDVEHCHLCNICILNCDHHCIFFSKCIGLNNVSSFYSSIGCLMINMILMVICTVAYGNLDK